MARQTPALLESLEGRTLMSAASLARGVLRVAGDGASVNVITVRNTADAASIEIVIDSTTATGQAKPQFVRSFSKALGISAIQVRGGSRADTISVGQANATLAIGEFDLPTRVSSGPGDDVIVLTDAIDFVNPGPGNDNVTANGGNDVVFAGLGNDVVNAGDGDDVVRGMVGDDTIEGGPGVDRIDAGVGTDIVGGGIGNDILRGGGGDDTLWGGIGDDTVEGGQGNDFLGGVVGTNVLSGGQGADTFRVRDLALNPTNDFDPVDDLDILEVVTARTEGPRPPAI